MGGHTKNFELVHVTSLWEQLNYNCINPSWTEHKIWSTIIYCKIDHVNSFTKYSYYNSNKRTRYPQHDCDPTIVYARSTSLGKSVGYWFMLCHTSPCPSTVHFFRYSARSCSRSAAVGIRGVIPLIFRFRTTSCCNTNEQNDIYGMIETWRSSM